MLLEGQVGVNRGGVADGTDVAIRFAKTGDLVSCAGVPSFHEAVSRGWAFSGVTAVSGVAPGTSLSTTAAFTLHNPQGSGKLFSLVRASMGYLSGTLGAGSTYLTTHAAGAAVSAPTGTPITPRNSLVGSTTASSAICLTTATVATQFAIRPVWSFGPYLATSVLQERPCETVFDGEFVVSPGYGVNLHSIATAGTSPLVLLSMTWIEVPIPS